MTLADKIAAARPEETRELLIELWKQTSSFSGDCLSNEYLEWSRKKDAFWRKLDAEAYLSAVLMLLGGRAAIIHTNGMVALYESDDAIDSNKAPIAEVEAETTALALAAAIARSVG